MSSMSPLKVQSINAEFALSILGQTFLSKSHTKAPLTVESVL